MRSMILPFPSSPHWAPNTLTAGIWTLVGLAEEEARSSGAAFGSAGSCGGARNRPRGFRATQAEGRFSPSRWGAASLFDAGAPGRRRGRVGLDQEEGVFEAAP